MGVIGRSLALGGLLLGGLAAAATPPAAPPPAEPPPVERAMRLIEERLPDRVDRAELERAAVAGMAARLDEALGARANRVLDEEEAAEAAAWERGERRGVGIAYRLVPGRGLLVEAVHPGTPAAEAGVEPGDLVVGIDGRALTGLAAGALDAAVAARSDEALTLDLRRRDGGLRTVRLPVRPYRLPGARLAEGPPLPVVRVPFLGEGAADALADILADLESAGARNVCLDLRDAGGGLIDEAVAAADLFLPPGSLVAEVGHPDGSVDSLAVRGEQVWEGGVVLLVDGGTAGPAEALVAALQDHRRAMAVGTPTAGQAWLTSRLPLGGGLVLELADRPLRSPAGRSWAGTGLEPDVRVEPADLALPAAGEGWPLDLQRDAALRLMGGAEAR